MLDLLAGAAISPALFSAVLADDAPRVALVAEADAETPVVVRGELIVCIESDEPIDLAAGFVNEPGGDDARMLMQWVRRNAARTTNVILLRSADGSDLDPETVRRRFADLGDVQWVAPNRAILGDPREAVPNDPSFSGQYHHDLMESAAAWDVTLGSSSIVVAVTDDGVDLDHEDLVANVWVNPGEVPGDGIDNDINGYVDDVNGFDILNGNANPNPENGNDHGTHCAGIAAARTNNETGVSGTAGGSTIMPVQFYTTGQPWTAAVIAESFAYATDNGAQIITTSYNINGWVDDPVVNAAFDYLYDNQVLHFNSAGNGNDLNPPRQRFHQTLLVANTTESDQRSGSSNYGTGVDLAAPGTSILSTVLNDGYGLKSGTSMAAPNAAGVAALIWSANPTWTRDQVAAQVVGTCDNIDAQNPDYAGLLGSGRVNARRAVTESLATPNLGVIDGLPIDGSIAFDTFGPVVVRFDQIMSPATVNASDAFDLRGSGPDGEFGTADDVVVPLVYDEYMISTNELVLTIDGLLPSPAEMQFRIRGSVLTNPFGQRLDGDGNGAPGGDLVVSFSTCATSVLVEDFVESGAGWTVQNSAIDDGAWDLAPSVPAGGGDRSDPASDFDGSGRCFLTDNVDGNSDVDGGPTTLTSYAFDLAAVPDPVLSYARWFESTGNDVMVVRVSNDDGGTWTVVETVSGASTWGVHQFAVADFVEPTSTVRLQFEVSDNPNDSVVEAGIDHLRVLELSCGGDPVPNPDIDGNGTVDLADLLTLLAAWGPCPDGVPCPADVDQDGSVGLPDLLAVLAAWS